VDVPARTGIERSAWKKYRIISIRKILMILIRIKLITLKIDLDKIYYQVIII